MLPPIFNKRGRPNLARDDFLQNIKEVVTGVRLSGAVISRKMVISIGDGFLKANDLNTLSESGGYITLTNDCARAILESMDWVKRKGTIRKIEPSSQLLHERRLSFRNSIATVAYDHDIPSDLPINLDQTLLF